MVVLRGGPLAGADGTLELALDVAELPPALRVAGGQYVRSEEHGLRYDWTPGPPCPHCNRTIKDGIADDWRCPHCEHPIDDAIQKARLEPPGIHPHNRLRYITARGTAEILEALAADDRLHHHDRELLSASCYQLMQIVQIIHDGREAEQ